MLELRLRESNRVQTCGALSHHTFSVWAEASQPSTKFAYHIKCPAFVKEAVAMDLHEILDLVQTWTNCDTVFNFLLIYLIFTLSASD